MKKPKPIDRPLSRWVLWWKDYRAQRQAVQVDADPNATGIEVIHALLEELIDGPGLGEANPDGPCHGYHLLDTTSGEKIYISISRSVDPEWGKLIPRRDPTEKPLDPTAEELQRLRAAVDRTARLLRSS